MRHKKRRTKLNRNQGQRKSLLIGLAKSLLLKARIMTTLDRAKEVRRIVEKLITIGKKGTLAARRQAYSKLQDRLVLVALFEQVAPVFTDRNGGYTRIIRTHTRAGDGAQMSYIELVEKPLKKESKEESEEQEEAKGTTKKGKAKASKVKKTEEPKSDEGEKKSKSFKVKSFLTRRKSSKKQETTDSKKSGEDKK